MITQTNLQDDPRRPHKQTEDQISKPAEKHQGRRGITEQT